MIKVNWELIKENRKKAGIKQLEVAKVLNVNQQAYSQYERGTRQISLIKAKVLSDFLEMNLNDFFY